MVEADQADGEVHQDVYVVCILTYSVFFSAILRVDRDVHPFISTASENLGRHSETWIIPSRKGSGLGSWDSGQTYDVEKVFVLSLDRVSDMHSQESASLSEIVDSYDRDNLRTA
jgi:hypothetical protein